MANNEESFSSPSSLQQVRSPRPKFLLVIRKPPPEYVFPGETIDFEVALEINTNQSPPSEMLVRATVEPSADINLVWLNEPRISPSRKLGRLRAKIDCSSGIVPSTGLSVRIKLSVAEPNVAPITTGAIHLVNAKIKVATTPQWSPIWYKDEGGREKCMEAIVSVYNRDNDVLFESIPLSFTLCYENDVNPIAVKNQDLLKILGPSTSIDKTTGQAKVRFRIEDVSKNHQGQDFRLKITAGNADIAPDFTPKVAVRSKRNKRPRSVGNTTLPRYTPPVRPFAMAQGPMDEQRQAELVDSIRTVVRWTDEVVNGLQPLQWQVVGYSQHPDGSFDYNRPYHNIQNPNAFISNVLTMYTDKVQASLRILQQVLEGSDAALSSSESTRDSYVQSYPPQNISPTMIQTDLPQQHMSMAPRDYSHHHHPPPSGPYFPTIQEQTRNLQPEIVHQGASFEPQPTQPELFFDRESEVEYVLAKQYKSLRTGERLGFPAYSADREIVGFYRESSTRGAGQFIPISQTDFSRIELQQARQILEENIAMKSDAVHALKNWGSISNMIDHALVYDWSKDI